MRWRGHEMKNVEKKRGGMYQYSTGQPDQLWQATFDEQ